MNNNIMISILKGIQKDYPLTNAEWQAIEQAKENAESEEISDCNLKLWHDIYEEEKRRTERSE